MNSKRRPKFLIKDDGVTHINVYSQGKTRLGRFLSNFAYAPIDTEDGRFNTIEGYWYWLAAGENPQKEILRGLSGHESKEYGRRLGCPDWINSEEFKQKICKAISQKMRSNPEMIKLLAETNLPLTHYYVYEERMVIVSRGQWLLDHIDLLRRQALGSSEKQ